jgi:hypothetical protein
MSEINHNSKSGSMPANLRRWAAITFQGLIVLNCLSGIAILVADTKTIAGALNLFSFYTIQSNLLAAAAMAMSIRNLVREEEDSKGLVIFKSGAMLWILVTGIVYQLMLAGMWQPAGLTACANQMVHYFTPLGMVLNWLIIEKKGRYRYAYAIYWLAYPFAYILGSWIRGWLTGFYAYWFFNPNQPYPAGAGSVGMMLIIVGGLALGFTGLGLLIVFIDRLLVKRS